MGEKGIKIAILTTKGRVYHPNRRLLEASSKLGCEAFLLHPQKVLPSTHWGLAQGPVAHVVIPRIGSTIEDHELAVLFHLETSGVKALNSFRSLFVARDKFLSLRKLAASGIPVPRTILVQRPTQLRRLIGELGGPPVVAKGLRGRQGIGVELVGEESFARYMVDHPPFPAGAIVLQEFISKASLGDVRIVVVRGEPIGSMKRVPKRGEFRSNVHLRGMGEPWEPPMEWKELAVKATQALELDVAGVDMVWGNDGPLVLEVNTTPGFRELERVTRKDIAACIVGAALDLARGG